MTAIDAAYQRTRSGDHEGFADWVRLVELRLRASVRRFARHVDTEAIVQEALLRMWKLAPTLDLDGEDASLRFATTIAANLARNEIRRAGRFAPLDEGDASTVAIEIDPPSDPALRAAIRACLERLRGRPRQALLARLHDAGRSPDRDLAGALGMTVNTFLQNVVRARTGLRECLESRRVPPFGLLP